MTENQIVALILLVIGVFFIILPIFYFRRRKFFAQNGIRTKATVTDVIKRISGGKRRRISYVHTLEYRADGVGTTSEITESYPRDVGYEYDILYSPNNPKKIMTAQQVDNVTKENVAAGVFIVIGVIMIIASAVMFFKQ